MLAARFRLTHSTQELTVCFGIRSLPIKESDAPFTFTTPPSAVYTVTTSHQIPPIANSAVAEAYQAPWFKITSTEMPTSYQWQIHPVEHGPLRYTLIEFPSSQDASALEPENQHRIKAIYYNVGVGASLVQPFSEGVLLLPANKNMSSDLENAAVTSLIGLLWMSRGVQKVKMEVPVLKETTKPKSKKNGSSFGRSPKESREDDVIR